jgi:hypothetical protein
VRFHSKHERVIQATAEAVGGLIDSLSSRDDKLWPWENWPAQRFNGPLAVGARGGHGPIRYTVQDYQPGRLVRYHFAPPPGFSGWHGFEVREHERGAVLQHVVHGQAGLRGWLRWQLVLRPLHDALIENALDKAETLAQDTPRQPRTWPLYVRLLRRLLAGRV